MIIPGPQIIPSVPSEAAANVPSLRTLGAGALQGMPGNTAVALSNDTRFLLGGWQRKLDMSLALEATQVLSGSTVSLGGYTWIVNAPTNDRNTTGGNGPVLTNGLGLRVRPKATVSRLNAPGISIALGALAPNIGVNTAIRAMMYVSSRAGTAPQCVAFIGFQYAYGCFSGIGSTGVKSGTYVFSSSTDGVLVTAAPWNTHDTVGITFPSGFFMLQSQSFSKVYETTMSCKSALTNYAQYIEGSFEAWGSAGYTLLPTQPLLKICASSFAGDNDDTGDFTISRIVFDVKDDE